MKGKAVPEDILKECQKKASKAGNDRQLDHTTLINADDCMSTDDEHAVWCVFLQVLEFIHRRRKEAHRIYKSAPNRPVPDLWKLPPSKTFELPATISGNKSARIDGSRIWVLSIGNNGYKSPTSSLQGSIQDAVYFQNYCKIFLGVPAEPNMRLLKNATRKSMIDALYKIRDNDEMHMQPGDTFIFQYSGHGTSYDPVAYKYPGPVAEIRGSIEALCPVDRGKFVPDISDRELNNILNAIQKEREVNIAVVLDCCHSGGAIRVPDAAGDLWATRYVDPLMYRLDTPGSDLETMLLTGDEDTRRREDTPLINDAAWMGDIENLVLLAASQDFQVTAEGNFEVPVVLIPGVSQSSPSQQHSLKPCGRFTSALLNVLVSGSIGQVKTFEGVMESVGEFGDKQVPVLLGGRKTSTLWFRDEQ